MTQPDVELVRQIFAAFGTGDVDAVRDLMADDFVLVVPPSMSAEPDVYEGVDGARRYMAGFDGVVDDVRFHAAELHPERNCVIAVVRITGRGTASGIPVELEAASIVRVRDGKVTSIESHPDLAAAREALAPR